MCYPVLILVTRWIIVELPPQPASRDAAVTLIKHQEGVSEEDTLDGTLDHSN